MRDCKVANLVCNKVYDRGGGLPLKLYSLEEAVPQLLLIFFSFLEGRIMNVFSSEGEKSTFKLPLLRPKMGRSTYPRITYVKSTCRVLGKSQSSTKNCKC